MMAEARRKTKDTGLPPPLLLLPASQSLTFTRDEGPPLPGVFMPVPQLAKQGTDGFTVSEFDKELSAAQEVPDARQAPHLQTSTNIDVIKASKSWNSFQECEEFHFAGSAQDTYGTLLSYRADFPHSSSTSQLSSSTSVSPGTGTVVSDAKGTAPPTAGFIPSKATIPPVQSAMMPPGNTQAKYIPVTYHWFFCKHRELRQFWEPFSFVDSINLEDVFRSGGTTEEKGMISTDGGRYQVDILSRLRRAIYWDEPESKVKRCSWFYRHDVDSRLVPYDEEFAEKLEEIYKSTVNLGNWHQKHEFPNGDTIILHSPTVIMHFSVPQTKTWNSTVPNDPQPRMVKRGSDDLDNIYEGEPTQIDHLVFIVHGIGPTCDMRFRNIIECVDDFRTVSHQMLASHFKQQQDEELIGRVEYLPVRWHAALHGDATGIDRKLKAITLNSIGKLRQFTNDTLIDVLFYGSPAYAQKIADTVGNEINRLHKLFLSHNPDFRGGISVAGHSLGSLIVFDLLVHQKPLSLMQVQSEEMYSAVSSLDSCQALIESFTDFEKEGVLSDSEVVPELTVNGILSQLNLVDYTELFQREEIDIDTLLMIEDKDLKELGLPLGPRKKILCFINDHKRSRNKKVSLPVSPVGNTSSEFPIPDSGETVGMDVQDLNNADPVLHSASSTSVNFVVGDAGTGIPFIRYPQLDFSPDNFFSLGSPIAMFLTVRGVDHLGENFRLPTCSGFFNIFHPFDPVAYRVEPMVTNSFPIKPVLIPHHKGRKRLHLELKESLSRVGSDLKQKVIESVKNTWRTINDFALAHRSSASKETAAEDNIDKDDDSITSEVAKDFDDVMSTCSMIGDEEYAIGILNQGRRVDYVLQEKPIESFNEYLFALSSHGCYWDSEDTVLLLLKEIYLQMGIVSQKQGSEPAVMPTGIFPRHPLAQQFRPGHPIQVTASMPAPPATTDASLIGSTSTSTPPCVLPANAENSIHLANIGPPPITGFVRKQNA